MQKSDFNKVANNFIKIAIRHGCSPVNLLRIFTALFPKNTSGGLLPYFALKFESILKPMNQQKNYIPLL